jgi:hypothetical protein
LFDSSIHSRAAQSGKKLEHTFGPVFRKLHLMAVGPTISVGDVRVTPESRVVRVELPFGGFVWSRPAAVIVERPDGLVEHRRILDVTRIVQLALLACAVAAWVLSRKDKKHD